MNNKSRIEEYKNLRDEIDNIDVYSFEDHKRLPPTKSTAAVEIHDPDYSDDDAFFGFDEKKVNEEHIKKNTLSLSIDELIKRHEAYTEAIQKEELEKKIKDQKSTNKSNRFKINLNIRLLAWVFLGIIVVTIITVICLIIGGVI